MARHTGAAPEQIFLSVFILQATSVPAEAMLRRRGTHPDGPFLWGCQANHTPNESLHGQTMP